MKIKTWVKKHKTILIGAGCTIAGGIVGSAVMKKAGYDKATELLCALYDDGVISVDVIYDCWYKLDHGLERFGNYANWDYVFDVNR